MELAVLALGLGFLSSFHCVGMCGPIALAVPAIPGLQRWQSVLLYNTGRIITYALLGITVGIIGKTVALAGFQRVLSVAVGVAILLWLILPQHKGAGGGMTKIIYSSISKLKYLLAKYLKVKSTSGVLVIGLLNGFLPCGMVYMALAAAAVTANIYTATLFMLLFGVATWPLMFSVAFLGSVLSVAWRNRIRKAVPVFAALVACLLILRGMNLGIPYVSPGMDTHSTVCK